MKPIPTSDVCTTPYLSPRSLFERLRLDRFVGRAWLTGCLDAFLQEHDRGYLVLEAETGLGKTAFLAHLAAERGYIHLFVEQARGLDNFADGLRSLAAQIIRVWKLHTWFTDDVVLPGVAVRPDFLSRLLSVAAHRRDQVQPAAPIVLVIDGLEEAGVFPGQNVLGLPRLLPHGVYIVASQRPQLLGLVVEAPRQQLTFLASDPRNLDDMRRYLEEAMQRPALREALRTSDYTEDYVIRSLLATCRGVWSFLVHVLDEVERGYAPLDPDALPDTMCSYYAQYWRRQQRRNPQQWTPLLLPLLTTLCAVQESVSAEMLVKLAGVGTGDSPGVSPHLLRSLLTEHWRPFLTIEGEGGTVPRYSLGESSMRGFLSGCISEPVMSQADRTLSEELVAATRQAHHRIADHYLEGWGGLDRGLPELARLDGHTLEHLYGLRHLVAHLESARGYGDIHRLMGLEHHSPTLVWYVARGQQGDLADFLCDVAQAWQVAEEQGKGQPEAAAITIGLLCRYALMHASVNSLSHDIPLPLLAALLEHHIWLPDQAITYIQEMTDEAQQAWSLVTVAPHLPEEMLADALAIVRAMEDEQDRATALKGLAAQVPPAWVPEVLAVVRAMSHPGWRVMALVGCVPHVPEHERSTLLAEALKTIRTIWHAGFRADALVELAPHLPEPLQHEALDLARSILDEGWRAKALIGLAHHLPTPLLREALGMWDIWKDTWRAKVLAELSSRLEELGTGDRERAMGVVRKIGNGQEQVQALAGLAPFLSGSQLHEALEIVRSLRHTGADTREQAKALTALAPYLSPLQQHEALAMARNIPDLAGRVRAFAGLLPYLPPESLRPLAQEMLAAARDMEDQQEQEIILMGTAAKLAETGYAQQVIETVRGLEDRRERVCLLVELAPHLSRLDPACLPEVLEDVQHIQHPRQRQRSLAKLAPHLPATLLPRALEIARTIGDGVDRVQTLVWLAHALPASFLPTLLNLVREVGNEQDRARLLVELVPVLPASLFPDALDLARAIETEDARRTALVGLAPALPASLLPTLLYRVQRIGQEHLRASALAGILPHLPDALLSRAFEMAREIRSEDDRSHVLHALAQIEQQSRRLPSSMLQKLLTEARAIQQSVHRSALLVVLVPHLARSGRWRQALDAAWGIGETDARAMTLASLAPYVPRIMLKEIMAAVRTMQQPDSRAWTLAAIRPHLPPEERPYLRDEVLRAAQVAKWQGAAAPSALAALLEPSEQPDILASVRMIDHPATRATALADLSPSLAEPLRSEALHEALTAVSTIWGPYRADALTTLAPFLKGNEHLLTEALEEARALERQEWRTTALMGLLPFLSPSQQRAVVQEPLEVARNTWNLSDRARSLARMVPWVDEQEGAALFGEALEAAQHIDDQSERFSALRMVAEVSATRATSAATTATTDQHHPYHPYRCWCRALRVLSTRTRRDLLSDLNAIAPALTALAGDEAIAEGAQAVIDVGRWFA